MLRLNAGAASLVLDLVKGGDRMKVPESITLPEAAREMLKTAAATPRSDVISKHEAIDLALTEIKRRWPLFFRPEECTE